MIKGERTDWQLALNLLQGAVGVPWRECPLDFRRERSGEEGGPLSSAWCMAEVLALNSFAFLWFKSRIFFFFIYIIIILSC